MFFIRQTTEVFSFKYKSKVIWLHLSTYYDLVREIFESAKTHAEINPSLWHLGITYKPATHQNLWPQGVTVRDAHFMPILVLNRMVTINDEATNNLTILLYGPSILKWHLMWYFKMDEKQRHVPVCEMKLLSSEFWDTGTGPKNTFSQGILISNVV